MAGLADIGSKAHNDHLLKGLNPVSLLNPYKTAKHALKGTKMLLTKQLPPEAPVVPLPDEELIKDNRRKSINRRQRTGRASTVLSDGLGS